MVAEANGMSRPRFVARVVARAAPPEPTLITTELPPGRFEPPAPSVHIRDVAIRNVDFSKLRGSNWTSGGTTFENCRFDEFATEHATLGVPPASVFRDCSFRNADLRTAQPGHARFERCDFGGSRIEDWFAFCAEFVDCVFPHAQIVGSKFSGKPLECFGLFEFRRRRRRNEFRGNDFSQAELIDTLFVGGIDLDLQRLPEREPYFRLDGARDRVRHAVRELDRDERHPAHDALLSRLRTLGSFSEDQDDLLLRRDELDVPPADEERLIELLGVTHRR
jgi:hypothetical protein